MKRKVTVPFDQIEMRGCSLHQTSELVIEFDLDQLKENFGLESSRSVRIVLQSDNATASDNSSFVLGKDSSTEIKRKLTAREKEVLQLLSKGFASKQIAQLLCRSVNTVNTHRQRIIEKLGVKNTVEAVHYVQTASLGLL